MYQRFRKQDRQSLTASTPNKTLRTLIMLSDQPEHGKNNIIKCLLCSRSNQLLTVSVQLISNKNKYWISFSFHRKNHSNSNKINVTNKAAFLQRFSSSLELTAIQNMRLPSNHQIRMKRSCKYIWQCKQRPGGKYLIMFQKYLLQHFIGIRAYCLLYIE